MFDFGLYTQVSDSGPHGPLVSVLLEQSFWVVLIAQLVEVTDSAVLGGVVQVRSCFRDYYNYSHGGS